MSKITVTYLYELDVYGYQMESHFVVMRPEWEFSCGPMIGSFGEAVDCVADNTNLPISLIHDHVLNAGDGKLVVLEATNYDED